MPVAVRDKYDPPWLHCMPCTWELTKTFRKIRCPHSTVLADPPSCAHQHMSSMAGVNYNGSLVQRVVQASSMLGGPWMAAERSRRCAFGSLDIGGPEIRVSSHTILHSAILRFVVTAAWILMSKWNSLHDCRLQHAHLSVVLQCTHQLIAI